MKCRFIPIFFIISLLSFAKSPTDWLNQEFRGFSSEGMAPIFRLFEEDVEGRLLMSGTLKRLGLNHPEELVGHLGFCTQDGFSHPKQWGAIQIETVHFFREKGTEQWTAEVHGALQRISQLDADEIYAQRTYETELFEWMEVAFPPKICIKQGLSNLQTFLVIFHELVHLVGLEPLDHVDLLAFDPFNKNERTEKFYYHQLDRAGGEVDAYLAQMNAYVRLRERYGITSKWQIESFLNPQGRLIGRDRTAFREYLLDQGGYRDMLDFHLEIEVFRQYNRAQSWWDYYERRLAALKLQIDTAQQNVKISEINLSRARQAKHPQAEDHWIYERKRWINERILMEREVKAIQRDQSHLIKFMDRVDKVYPR